MQLLQTLFSFALVLGVLIAFHEYGHYWVARRCGVKVLRFSLGFGRPVWSTRRGTDQTEWAIGAFPLGGYVKMLDEREGEVDPAELGRAFNRQTVGRRFLIVLAGPVANLLLAVVIFWGLMLSGVDDMRAVLGDVPPNTPAASAGFRPGDEILAVNGVSVKNWTEMHMAVLAQAVEHKQVDFDIRTASLEPVRRSLDFSRNQFEEVDDRVLSEAGISIYRHLPVIAYLDPKGAASAAGLLVGDRILAIGGQPVRQWPDVVHIVRTSPGRNISLHIQRGARVLDLPLAVRADQEGGKLVGKIGVAPQIDRDALKALQFTVHYGPVDALGAAVAKTWDNALLSLKMFGKMLTGSISIKNLSGPVTIADYAGQAARLGPATLLEFLAAISISLGVLNLLPVPLLDGGHLMYYTAEFIRGRPLSERVMEIGQHVGLTLLLALMAFAFYNDINRLLAG